MRMLERWLEEFSPAQKILDLGCGPGSMPAQLAGLNVTGVDVDPKSISRTFPSACADSHRLPFAGASFDLVICHHTLEHFHDIPGTIREIRRVLRPDGRLFVSVPDGYSFSDWLYRFLLCGGGHLQCFTLKRIVAEVESGTGLHLAGWKELSTSFIFVNKRNFVPAPRGPLSGPLPRRMRWAATMPAWCFSGGRIFLNVASRLTRCSRYGWALAFTPEKRSPEEEPGSVNVCMFCGTGFDREPARVAVFFYRCPNCSGRNILFRQGVKRSSRKAKRQP
jgi:SAM-dependent methyltransferase